MPSEPRETLERAWAAATATLRVEAPEPLLRDVLAELPPELAALLQDGGRDAAGAARLLRDHAGEALVARAALARWCGSALAAAAEPEDDPAARLLRRLPAARRRAAAAAIDAELARLDQAPPAPLLFASAFSPRAQKRRGGVYTAPTLVECLLDLVGWEGRGSLLEPAVGDGAFLVRAWTRGLDAGRPPAELAEALAGVDVHPFACRAARAGLALEAARRGLDPSVLPRVRCGDALLDERPDLPSAALGQWDVVIGNPPYVRGERLPPARRAAYRSRFPGVSQGNLDLAAYFLRRAFAWLRPGGRVGFVLTQGLLDARSSAPLRDLVAEHAIEAVVSLEWAPDLFPGAQVIPCLLVVRNAPAPRDQRLSLGRGRFRGGRLTIDRCRLHQRSWLGVARRRWPVSLERGDLGFLRRLRRAPTPLAAGYGLAIRTGHGGAARFIADGPAPAHFQRPRPLVDGREVRSWTIDAGGRLLDYRPECISDPKSEAYFRAPKVLLPRIALTAQAAVDEGPQPFFCRNTVMIVRAPGTPLDAAPHALAAVINSLPLRVYAFLLLRAGVLANSHRATFYVGVVGDFPIPGPLLEDAALRRRLGRLGRRARAQALAEEAVALARTEAAVDELVAAAFGLAPRELARLRARADREPLATILRPRRPRSRTRRIAPQAYAAGERYR